MEFGYSKFIKKCSWIQDTYKKSGEGTRIEERKRSQVILQKPTAQLTPLEVLEIKYFFRVVLILGWMAQALYPNIN